MRNGFARLAIVLALLAAMLCAPLERVSVARQSGSPQRDESQIELGAELVLLDVSVADRAGRPVTTVARDRFAVFEDGVRQDVEFFSSGDAPASIVFVLDTSGSMRLKIPQVTAAASRVVDGRRAGDEFAIVEFRETADLIEEFTSEPRDVREALDGIVAYGQTAVVDAVYVSADYAQRESRNRLKALVLVTDGLDKNSYFSLNRLVSHLRGLDVRLYIVGLTSDLSDNGGIFKASDKEKAHGLLTELARDTGGRAFFPERLEEVGAVNAAIAADLRSVYSIGYYPKNQKKDGSFRSVAVKVLGKDEKEDSSFVVRTRSGYVAEKS